MQRGLNRLALLGSFAMAFVCKAPGQIVVPQPDGHAYFISLPQPVTNSPGSPFCLEAQALGDPIISATWYKDGQPLAPGGRITITSAISALGIFQTSVCVVNADPSDSGSYSVSVQNAAPPSISPGVAVLIGAPPTVQCPPQSRTNRLAGVAAFQVFARGSPGPLGYQWFHGTTPLQDTSRIRGSTSSQLLILQLESSDLGTYSVRVSNPLGSVTSAGADLSFETLLTTQFESRPRGITIPAFGPALPYPSLAPVSRVSDIVTGLRLTLEDLTHGYVGDLDILLTNPEDIGCIVLSDAGNKAPASHLTNTFHLRASARLPQLGPVTSGEYLPTDYTDVPQDSFPPPAPPGPYPSDLSALLRGDPNGLWKLFVVDDAADEGGSLAGGWSLQFEVERLVQGCAAPPLGLVGWWRGEGDAVDSVGAAHGVPSTCGVSFPTGRVGRAFKLSAPGDFITLPGAYFAAIPTLIMWMRSPSARQGIIDGGAGQNGYVSWRVGIDATGVALYQHFAAGVGRYLEIRGQKLIDDGKWHLLATQADPVQRTLRLFVDGRLEAELPVTDPSFEYWAAAESGAPALGRCDAAGLAAASYAGEVDELQVYDRVLMPHEIEGIYAADSAGLCLAGCPPGPATLALSVGRNQSVEVLCRTCPGARYILESTPKLGADASWTVYHQGNAGPDGMGYVQETRRLPAGFYRLR